MNWLRQKWTWAREKPLVWWNLLLFVAVVVVAFVAPSPNGGDLRLRILGSALQLIGVATVWLDLTSTARQFGKPGMFAETWRWLKTGVFKRNIVVHALGAGILTITGHARGKARTTIHANASIEQRVTNLESVTKQIDESLDRAYDEFERRAAELEGKVNAEGSVRAAAIAEVKKSLESAATGNFAKLAFGAFWLAIGIVLATLAPEIAKTIDGHADEAWRSL